VADTNAHLSNLLVTEHAVREALREVIDPELGESLVELGLVYDIRTDGDRVEVDLTLTTPGCPLHASLLGAAEWAINCHVPGVRETSVRLVFDPPWTPDRMSAAAKQRLGFH
jgi:metal-sulfur cluster biosynthetic enzyme